MKYIRGFNPSNDTFYNRRNCSIDESIFPKSNIKSNQITHEIRNDFSTPDINIMESLEDELEILMDLDAEETIESSPPLN